MTCAFICLMCYQCIDHDADVQRFVYHEGAIIRADTTIGNLALVFTGDQFADGAETILDVLESFDVKASFFLTGNFYNNEHFNNIVYRIKNEGHYLGAHSDKHLLYCSWENRDSLLVTRQEFREDLKNNYIKMASFGIQKNEARYFLPPYEWYNRMIAEWTTEMGLTLINFTPGTYSHADYTLPGRNSNYFSSEKILNSIYSYENNYGMNGFILLMHIGTHPNRTDKLYDRLSELLTFLSDRHYKCLRIDSLLAGARQHTQL